ncbi:MAG: SMI1/KNR4 family protein [Promethearchaeota archaeon]
MKDEKDKIENIEVPKRHAALENPKNKFERLISKLDSKLARVETWDAKLGKSVPRDKQDLSNPHNWLVITKEKDINEIVKKWNLPSLYVDFLTRFSPLDVAIYAELFVNYLRLYGAFDLIQNQLGYSIDLNTGEIIDDWPKDYVVIADDTADPYVLDLSKSNGEDAPVLYALHGTGNWEFEPEAESFYEFIENIIDSLWKEEE